MSNQMSENLIREINCRMFFSLGTAKGSAELRPWQYVEMEYARMGLTPPPYIPPLESVEDAEIWMCLDERVNRRMRMRESALAG